jgi:hypothetical protein
MEEQSGIEVRVQGQGLEF